MSTVFISGSIGIKKLDLRAQKRIDNIIFSNFKIILGDAAGVDLSVQRYLLEKKAPFVTIYCSGSSPRNNVGEWEVKYIKTSHIPNTRAFFMAKDLKLAEDADYGLMIWDAKSPGTLSNVIELLRQKKKSVVYIDISKEFINVLNVQDLEKLMGYMTTPALTEAISKIKLNKRIDSLKSEQMSLL